MPIAPESRVLPSDTTEGKSINKVVVCMYKTANQANQVNISSTIVVQVLCSEGIMVSHGAWMVAAFPAGRASMGRPPRRDRRDATAINRPTWRLGPLRSVASVSGRRHSASYRQRCGTITHQNIGEMGHREWGSEKGNLEGEKTCTRGYTLQSGPEGGLAGVGVEVGRAVLKLHAEVLSGTMVQVPYGTRLM